MNVLIIYAHPNPKSFCHAILDQVKWGLEDGKHIFNIIDLYEDNFDPVLVYNENFKRSDLVNNVEIKHYQDLIEQAEHLIFIYPIWWYGMPAILKGFIDRLFVSGFAYTAKNRFSKGLFRNKSAWVIYTLDAPSWYVKLFRRSIEWLAIRDVVLKYCGIKHVKRMMFAGVKTSTLKKRKKWLDYVNNQIRKGLPNSY